MTFGSNPADIIVVLEFTRRLYRQCKNASDEHFEISREVRALHTVLRHLKYEVQAPESILNRDRARYTRDLAPLIADCHSTLVELDGLVRKYERIRGDERGANGRLWKQIKFGSTEMDQLGSARVRLINHKTSITMLLDTIQLRESGRVAATLDAHGGQLDVILDKVDNIAARMGQRAGSLMTTYDDDDKEVWKSFRRELVAEGFSSDVLTQHKDVLRAYIRQIDQNGLLDEMPPGSKPRQSALSVNTDEWLDRVQSPMSTSAPPSFNTSNSGSGDSSIKELSVREENLKFPQSIKGQRSNPESRADGRNEGIGDAPVPSGQPALRPGSLGNGDGSRFAPNYGPPMSMVLKPSIPEPVVCTTDVILADDFAHENKMRLLEAPRSDRRTRRPSDQSDRDYPNSPAQGSPISARSSTSFTDANAMPYRPRSQQLASEGSLYGTSPRASGGLAIPPKPVSHAPSDRYGNSPRSTTTPISSSLAPDPQGRDIPRDAKWTKIRRSLISTKVLEEDRLRYEARPEYVAILGILTIDQIQNLADRTSAVRSARRARSQAARPIPQPRPTEPIAVPAPKKAVHFHDDKDVESDTDSTDSSSSDDDRSANDRRRNRDRNRRPNYPSQYPQQHAQRHSLPQAFSHGPSSSSPQHYASPAEYGAVPQQWMANTNAQHYPPGADGGGRGRRGRESVPRGGNGRGAPNGRKWSDRLTAASIGGAAGSLLSVLTEAAGDISL